MRFDLAQLRARFSTTAASPRNGRGGGQGHPLRSTGSKGVEMITAETTIATSVSAKADVSMQSLARKTAITLVLSVAKSMTQATLLSEMTPKGARATVHALAPEPSTVALTVTPMVTRRDQSDQLRMLAAIHIEVTAETPECAHQLIDVLMDCVPNRVIKPMVVVRSPEYSAPVCAVESSAWRELHAWRQARA